MDILQEVKKFRELTEIVREQAEVMEEGMQKILDNTKQAAKEISKILSNTGV